jgi:hypothetical protein
MIKTLIICFVLTTGLLKQSSDYTKAKNEKLSILSLDSEFLNQTVFRLINEKRRKKGVDTLEYSAELNNVCRKYQDELEFRRFKNTPSIERKINKQLSSRTKKSGFKEQDFFIMKTETKSEFKLFYGKRPSKNAKNKTRKEVQPLNYFHFAKNILRKLESENKKQLYAKSYNWGGLHLQWYYKSLNKRKIPEIKMIFLLGGHQTAGMW